MDDRTEKALEKSIEHWIEDNVKAEKTEDAKIGCDSCALCNLFGTKEGCEDCLVFKKTGKHFCIGTPYDAAYKAIDTWQWDVKDKNRREAFNNASQDMVDFLISLRPEKTNE